MLILFLNFQIFFVFQVVQKHKTVIFCFCFSVTKLGKGSIIHLVPMLCILKYALFSLILAPVPRSN